MLHGLLCNLVVRLVLSSILHIWYVEVRISRSVSEGPLDFEIMRVDCILYKRNKYDLRCDKVLTHKYSRTSMGQTPLRP